MRRIHIMLTEKQYGWLLRESALSGVSKGEYIRRAIDFTYRVHEPRRVAGLEVSVGVRRDPDPATIGKRLVRRLRL